MIRGKSIVSLGEVKGLLREDRDFFKELRPDSLLALCTQPVEPVEPVEG
jgi:hypothetical protein